MREPVLGGWPRTLRRCLLSGLLLVGVSAQPARAQMSDAEYDWPRFKDAPYLIDICARAIAYDRVPKNTYRDWPAVCNEFRNTPLVKARVAALRTNLAQLRLTDQQKATIRAGDVWIGMTTEMAELAAGRPKRRHRTITAAGTSETWVCDEKTLVFVNGSLSAIED